MKNKRKKRTTLKRLIFLFFVGLLVSQAGLLLLLYHNFGITNHLRQADVYNFSEKLLGQKQRIEDILAKEWLVYDHFGEVNTLTNDQYLSTQQRRQRFEVDQEIATALIDMTQNMNVSGGFVILDGNPQDETTAKEIFYITDNNPDLSSRKRNDIMVEAGSLELARSLQLTTNSSWQPNFYLAEEPLSQIYRKVRQGVHDNPSMVNSDLGCWSDIYRTSRNSADVISYVIPLISSDQETFYGVVGIIIELNYFAKLLLDEPEFKDNQTSFGLAKLEKVEGERYTFRSIFTKGFHKNIILKNQQIVLADERANQLETENPIYVVETKNYNHSVVASFLPVKQYSPISPYAEEQWYLLNIINESSLFYQSTDIEHRITLLFIASLVVQAIGYFLISFFSSRAVSSLIQRIKAITPASNKIPIKSSIEEAQQIIATIQSLNLDIADSASRMEQIFNIADIAIGAIEASSRSNQVRVMGKAYEMLKIEKEFAKQPFMNKEQFDQAFTKFVSEATPVTNYFPAIDQFDTNIYQTTNVDQEVVYLSIHMKTTQTKRLTIVIDETKKINAIQQVEFERDHDSLTGLLSREAFRQAVQQRLERPLEKAVMIMWDLDNLKYINDTYGHNVGDQYIQQMANTLRTVNLPNMLLSRISGDEFFAFASDFDSRRQILEVLEQAKQRLLATTIRLADGIEIKIRATTGLAWYDQGSNQLENLFKHADFAMYSAKNSEKGSIKEFDFKEYQSDYILFSAKEELNEFIEQKQVRFAFQPIVQAKTGRVFGYEILMRPLSDKLKTVTDVLRLAKSQSKLLQIEELTWFCGLEQVSQKLEQFGQAKIFINSIPNTILEQNKREELEHKYGSLLERVVIEMIELEQTNLDYLAMKQGYKKNWECQIALDDYGAGYNSESVLLAMSPDYIKIDMAIIRNINQDPQRQKLVANIVDYARTKQIKTIAEGIETKAEKATAIKLGVDYLQGYYIGRPEFEPEKTIVR